MSLVAFYGFFRLHELTAKGANLRPLVHVEDLSLQWCHSCVTSASIVIEGFKHNTSGCPFLANLESAKDVAFCQVNYFKQYSSLPSSVRGPLFCFADKVPVKTTHFTEQLRQALIFCGLHCSRYKSHFFRIGQLKRVYQMVKFATLVVANSSTSKFLLKLIIALQSWLGVALVLDNVFH